MGMFKELWVRPGAEHIAWLVDPMSPSQEPCEAVPDPQERKRLRGDSA